MDISLERLYKIAYEQLHEPLPELIIGNIVVSVGDDVIYCTYNNTFRYWRRLIISKAIVVLFIEVINDAHLVYRLTFLHVSGSTDETYLLLVNFPCLIIHIYFVSFVESHDDMSSLPLCSLHLMFSDVKPSNVLLNRAGFIKLCDFGIAANLVDSVAHTRDVGCQPYMAVNVCIYLNNNSDLAGKICRIGRIRYSIGCLESRHYAGWLHLLINKYPYRICRLKSLPVIIHSKNFIGCQCSNNSHRLSMVIRPC
jgi:serine/threonine protein kinase